MMAYHGLSTFGLATESVQYLQAILPAELKTPVVGIICGSGLGGLASSVHANPRAEAAYADIPNFPQSTGTGCDRILAAVDSDWSQFMAMQGKPCSVSLAQGERLQSSW